MEWNSKYFYGNEISEYGLQNGYVDYRTLAKAFDAVLNNEIIPATSEIGFWDIVTRIDDFIDDFTVNRDRYETRKSVMNYYEIPYNPTLCYKLTEYTNKVPYISDIDQVATFLSLTTGRRWNTSTARGYCQGDYANMLYCADIYTARDAEIYGDYYFGCVKEFDVTTLDENGAEIETIGGFFVADSEIENWHDSDQEYKRLVCNTAGIDINAATLELIDSSRTVTTYSYRAI